MPRRLPRRDIVGRVLDFLSRPHLPSYGEIALGLLALVATYWLAQRQITLAERQLDIMVKQDAILNQRASLSLTAERFKPTEADSDTSVHYRLYVYNDGQAAARDFYSTILVDPTELTLVNSLNVVANSQNSENVMLNGRTFYARRSLHTEPVYPKRRLVLGEFMFEPKSQQPVSLYWQLSTDSGVVPSIAQPGGLEVDGLFTSVVKLDASPGP